VTLLFGGAGDTLPVIVHVWDDAAGALDPGTEIYSDSFSLTGSNTQLQLIDFGIANVTVSGPFRVGIEFLHSGLPSIASDTDGSINIPHNLIFADFSPLGFFWLESADFGVTGDWVIRATVESSAGSAVPTLPGWGSGIVAGLLGIAGLVLARRAAGPRRSSAQRSA
jgi:hypothetical protein